MNSQPSIRQSSLKQWVAGFAAASIWFYPSVDLPWVFGPHDESPADMNSMRNAGLVIIGAIIGAISADLFGRKRTLLAALIFVIPRLILITLYHEGWIWIVQIIISLGSGITCTVVPLYISEIASTDNRGNLMIVQLLVFAFGLCVMMVSVIIFQYTDMNETVLAIINGLILMIPSLFHGITLGIFPETPHYLNSKKRYQEAAQSLAFFRGIGHVKIREEAIELSANPRTINRRSGCLGKLSEMMQFENRRSLAIIFTLITIRWVSGQYRNHMLLYIWGDRYFEDHRQYILPVTYALILIFVVLIMFTIGVLRRKIPLLFVIFGCFIVGIIGIPVFILYHPAWVAVLFIHHIGHLILVGATLAYAGEFFPISIRAMAIAVVISFEILMRNIILKTDYLVSIQVHLYSCGGIFLISFFFVMIFFPKNNKVPSLEIAIETSADRHCL